MVGTSLDPDFENDANSNEYVLAKISFDTAENEPSKILQRNGQALAKFRDKK